MFCLESIIRPHLRNFKAYASARDEFSGNASIYLDANESPFPSEFNRYPDSNQIELRKAGAQWLGVSPEQLLFTNGSDEGIDLLMRAFANPGSDKIVISSPTYGMYKVWADVSNLGITDVPLNSDFTLDFAGLRSCSDSTEKLLFICSPNNPSGNVFASEHILEIAHKFSGLVIVDEAYIEFSDSPSMLSKLSSCQNLVILRTFSKAWGLAGLRVGMLIASPQIVDVLRKIKSPYNLGSPAQRYIISSLGSKTERARVEKNIALIKAERSRLAAELKKNE